ncbi:hypothetical protein J2S10_004183 [Neobacillus ginsengisoli]|uniref:Uncharacterized protein n=1 Tax=Neobacillus ginsengisoli TaxID=904295 RepID=A0ABT9XZR5_9BACI|nr:hypothetical protein [Neobacillus ginsengisoli]
MEVEKYTVVVFDTGLAFSLIQKEGYLYNLVKFIKKTLNPLGT